MGMKYNLELWTYEPLEYEEAEEHLNQMAAKGWALRRDPVEAGRLVWQKKAIEWILMLAGNVLFVAAFHGAVEYIL